MNQDLDILSKKILNKEISPVELLQNYLTRIDSFDSQIKAFIEVEKEQALAEAKLSHERIVNGKALSPYDGIPIGIKDNMVQKGRRTQCASKILEGFVSPYDATVIVKLKKAGMIPIGRLNMDEFAMGSSTENSAFQTTRNPHNQEYAPGGSSGGSAAAVAAGFVPVSLGSDTGGSIRQPAAFNGVVGLKPTYGTVSRYGLVAYASSLDQIGPISRTVADSEIIYNIIKGHDPHDATSIADDKIQTPSFDLSSLKIAIVPSLLKGCSEDVRKSFEKVIDFLRKDLMAKVEEAELPYHQYGVPVYYILSTSEASANLSRFDGVRYGLRSKNITNLNDLYEKTRSEGFGAEVKRRILLGTYALSSGYYDAFYKKAQLLRGKIRQDYQKVFEKFDLVLIPSAPTVPFKIGEKNDLIEMYLSDLLTVGASLAGLPALSLPSPFETLPMGIQLQGNYFSEPLLFAVAKEIEKKFPAKTASL